MGRASREAGALGAAGPPRRRRCGRGWQLRLLTVSGHLKWAWGVSPSRRLQRWRLCLQDSACAASPGHSLRLRPLSRPCCAGGDGEPQGSDDTICLEAGPGSCYAMAEALRDMWKVAPLPNPRLTRWAARAPGMRTRAHFLQRRWYRSGSEAPSVWGT